MAKALSRSTSSLDALNKVLERWRDWIPDCAQKPLLVSSLGGNSNDNYLIASGPDKFVVRINSDNASLGVDRSTESVLLRNISEQAFSPDVIWQDQHCLVTRYIDGEHPHPSRLIEWLPQMGRLFASIHTTPVTITTRLDPQKHVLAYFERIEAPADTRLAACVEKLLAMPAAPPGELCLCHNDLLFENVIHTQTSWHAIDWEYSQLSDPAFDIAVFIETMNVDPAGVDLLLGAYGNIEVAPRIPYYRDLYRLIEILWWLLRDPDDSGHEERIASLQSRLASQDH